MSIAKRGLVMDSLVRMIHSRPFGYRQEVYLVIFVIDFIYALRIVLIFINVSKLLDAVIVVRSISLLIIEIVMITLIHLR